MGTDAKLTSSEVESLAPDASSLKSAKGLVKQAKWPKLEYSEHALWGECQGSGKNPYVAMVDMSQPDIAFKCSCPSRKFPCKHGLALLLNFVEHKDWFVAGTEPPHVAEWRDKRAANAEKKEQRAQEKLDKAKEALVKAQEQAAAVAAGKAPKAKSKTLLKREAAIEEGIAELKLWLKDCMRNGLLNVMDRRFKDIEHLKRRLVDAKAPALANILGAALQYDCSTNEGRRQYLKHLSRLYLIASAFENREQLAPAWQSEIARLVGIPTPKEEVLAAAIVAQGGKDVAPETVLVLADIPYAVSNGINHKYFCYRVARAEFGAYMLFVPSNAQAAAAMAERPLPVGTVLQAKVYPYPGVPQVPRILLEERTLLAQSEQVETCSSDFLVEEEAEQKAAREESMSFASSPPRTLSAADEAGIEQALQGVVTTAAEPQSQACWRALKGVAGLAPAVEGMSQYLAQNPFADFYPVIIELANFAQQGRPRTGTWYLCDREGRARLLSGRKEVLHDQVVTCLMHTGGAPFTAIVLLNDVDTILCGIVFEGRYLSLTYSEPKS